MSASPRVGADVKREEINGQETRQDSHVLDLESHTNGLTVNHVTDERVPWQCFSLGKLKKKG